MMRVDDSMDWSELHRTAQQMGRPVVYLVARCQHGKTQGQTCISCEGGYVDDTHTFCRPRGPVLKLDDGRVAIAVSDDGVDVAYIPQGK